MEREPTIRILVFGAGFLALVILVCLNLEQRSTIEQLHAAQRANLEELERLRARSKVVSHLENQEAELLQLRENNRDVLRLRNEVRRLRDQAQQSEVLQAANTRLLELIESFPLSSNQAAAVAAVRKMGAVLGIIPRPATDAPGGGIIVGGIDAGSPVAQSDLKVGDQILRLDGKRIETIAQLQIEMLNRKPGDIVRLDVVRNGAVIEIPVYTRAFPQ